MEQLQSPSLDLMCAWSYSGSGGQGVAAVTTVVAPLTYRGTRELLWSLSLQSMCAPLKIFKIISVKFLLCNIPILRTKKDMDINLSSKLFDLVSYS